MLSEQERGVYSNHWVQYIIMIENLLKLAAVCRPVLHLYVLNEYTQQNDHRVACNYQMTEMSGESRGLWLKYV